MKINEASFYRRLNLREALWQDGGYRVASRNSASAYRIAWENYNGLNGLRENLSEQFLFSSGAMLRMRAIKLRDLAVQEKILLLWNARCQYLTALWPLQTSL